MANILVTGSNRGIGLEITRQLSARGDTVYAACRDPDSASELQAMDNVIPVKVAVGEDDSVKTMAETLAGVTLDAIINNAGAGGPAKQTAYEMDFDGWSEAHNINAIGPVRVLHALLPNLRAAGTAKVVNISSQVGALALDMPMAYAYGATKAALNKYMKLAALELGKENIFVSILHPGWVQTDMGGPAADLTAIESAGGIITRMDELNAESNGKFLKWNGEPHAW